MRKYSFHWTLHPNKDEAWYNEQKQRMTSDEVARELDINYALSVSGKVFNQFRTDRHVSSEWIEYNPHLPIYRVWDFGKTNAILYAQLDKFNRKRFLFERVLSESDTFQQAKTCITDCSQYFPHCQYIDIADPSGSFPDGKGLSTHIEIVKEVIGINTMRFENILKLHTTQRKKQAITLIQKDMQQTPSDQEAFLLYASGDGKGCQVLKQALEGGYRYKTDKSGNITDTIQEEHPFEDVVDCMIYLYLETNISAIMDKSLFSVVESPYQHINRYTGY